MIKQDQLQKMVADRVAMVLFGPTASGKTGLGIQLANAFNAVIVNIDSRQLYQEMPIISAMPSDEEFKQADHRLFDFLKPDEAFDVMRYVALAKAEVDKIWAEGKIPLFVGGTGFYVKTLLEGMSPIPEISQEELHALNDECLQKGIETLWQETKNADPEWIAKIEENDKHRMLRGLAVYRKTGKPLTQWQALQKEGALNAKVIQLALIPEREVLYDRINKRYENMIDAGIVEEMKALKQKGYRADLPALTSIGIPEYFSYLEGEGELLEAHQKVATKQRQYAKRQCTWLRNQYNADIILESADADIAYEKITNLLNIKGY